jgi:tetratricopeptide (TPR) repeat protein
MGLRFGKSFRLGAGIRLNVSRSGIGVSAGIPGLRIGTGPRGTQLTASLPGTGLRYVHRLGSAPRSAAAPQAPVTPTGAAQRAAIPAPGIFAPAVEKTYVRALNAYQAGDQATALTEFQAIAAQEPSAALFAALILSNESGQGSRYLAIRMRESVLRWEATFPTPLMQKYLAVATFRIDITPYTVAIVPLGELLATLQLAELYQENQQLAEATGLLEEVEELAHEPPLTLSLCELYAHAGMWRGILERARGVKAVDDATLETAILHARALAAVGMNHAALTVLTEALRSKKNRNPLLLLEGGYWRALVYESTGRKAQARREFERLYAHAPGFRDVAQRLAASRAS